MIQYAKRNEINSVIIAGDLYDKKKISFEAKTKVLDTITLNTDINFYYLKGNHDSESLFSDIEVFPTNLKLFDEKWIYYDAGENVVICGIEVNKSNISDCYDKLNLDPRKINIVVMHGQENEYRNGDDTVVISIRELRNQNIDYLALGHIHSYKYKELDSRGHYCYSGCLEARGFDEIGEHGFVVLDIDEVNRTIKHEFIKIYPKHDVKQINIDITDINTAKGVIDKIDESFKKGRINDADIVKAVLLGEVNYDCNLNIDVIEKKLEDYCYAVKVEDKTSFKIDYEQFKKNKSLKGEFVRLVEMQKDLSEEDKIKIIRYGINALKGEEIG